MGYCSCVGAAIGGKPEQIKQFVQSLPSQNIPDELSILSEFKMVSLDTHLSLFVFYHDYFKWYEAAEATWKSLQSLANEAQLSYVFYRVGEDPADHENNNNGEESYYDCRMDDLFAFNFNLHVFHDSVLAAFDG